MVWEKSVLTTTPLTLPPTSETFQQGPLHCLPKSFSTGVLTPNKSLPHICRDCKSSYNCYCCESISSRECSCHFHILGKTWVIRQTKLSKPEEWVAGPLKRTGCELSVSMKMWSPERGRRSCTCVSPGHPPTASFMPLTGICVGVEFLLWLFLCCGDPGISISHWQISKWGGIL